MSDRASSDVERAEFTRWPGLMSLSLGLLLGPIIALVAQGVIYAANSWTCGRDIGATMHIIPALALIVSIGCGVGSFINWRAVGKGVEDEVGEVGARTRFLSILGISLSAFASLVIIAMWAAIFTFAPCMRA